MQKILRINYLAFFLLLLALGINVLIFNEKLYKLIIILLLIILGIDTIRQFIKLIVKKEINFLNTIIIIVTLASLMILLTYKNIPYSFVPIIFGVYIFLSGIMKFVFATILLINKIKGYLFNYLLSLFFFTIAITLMFSPLMHLKHVLYFIGIYLIGLSLNYLYEYYKDKKGLAKSNLRRNLRVPLPTIIEAFLPYVFLKQIDDSIKLYENKTGEKPDVEILIHVCEKGDGKVGHIDIYYENIVYSYGNYDPKSRRFLTVVGDGVLFKSEKKDYIKFCINDADKTLFGYGLKLNEKQKKALKKEMDKINNNLYEYDPSTTPDCYANKLNKKTKTKFYKIKEGRFKKYILLGCNCAHFIDKIIGSTGSDILKINGLINPGTYYEYLDNEFMKKNSIVIARTIYNSKSINDL